MASAESVRRFDLGLSWRAVLLGLVVGLSAQFLLTLLGVAIGLSRIEMAGGETNAHGIGFGAGLWALLVPIISWFFGAYAAAFASGVYDRAVCVLHGMATWGLGLVVVLSLLGSGLSGAFSASFGTIGTAAKTLSDAGLVRPSDVRQLEQGNARPQTQPPAAAVSPQDAHQAARNVAKAAWGAFATALLSFGSACLGGTAGGRNLMERLGVEESKDRDIPRRRPLTQTPRTT